MNARTIPIAAADAVRQRKRQHPKGRQVDPAVLAEVQAWLGDEPLRRDRLIEYLHAINDRLRCLPAPHLAALAQLMRLSQAEVFEVASFYHHFEVVKEGADGRVPAAPALTVRVCDGLACEMAGARDLLARLPALLGGEVRVIAAPCVGRCDSGAGGRGASVPGAARHAAGRAGRRAGRPHHRCGHGPHRASTPTCAQGGYRLLQQCHDGAARRRQRDPGAGRAPACAASAVPASRPGASGASCASSRRRACWR